MMISMQYGFRTHHSTSYLYNVCCDSGVKDKVTLLMTSVVQIQRFWSLGLKVRISLLLLF